MPKAANGSKECSQCGQVKLATLEEYAPSGRASDGLRSNCRECEKKSSKERYSKRSSVMQEKARAKRAADPEKYREIVNKSRVKHRDKRNAEQSAKYHGNPEPHRNRSKKYREENLEKVTATVKQWRSELKTEMHAAYGNKCACCEEKETKFLTLEHIGQTGSEHRKRLGGQMQVYTELRRLGWPKDGFTLLCMNCNFATRDGSICPHKIQPQKITCEAA